MLPWWYACHGTPDVTEPPISSRVFPTTVILSHLRHHSLVLSVYARVVYFHSPTFVCIWTQNHRELGQPVRLFSENVADIRERLRRFIAAVSERAKKNASRYLLFFAEAYNS